MFGGKPGNRGNQAVVEIALVPQPGGYFFWKPICVGNLVFEITIRSTRPRRDRHEGAGMECSSLQSVVGLPRSVYKNMIDSPKITGRHRGLRFTRTQRERQEWYDFVGNWKLVSFEMRLSNGKVFFPMGQSPVGRLTYDEKGNMSVIIARSERPFMSTDDKARASPKEKTEAFDGFEAYLGTYAVDRSEKSVTHGVKSALFPNWAGILQKDSIGLRGICSNSVPRQWSMPANGG